MPSQQAILVALIAASSAIAGALITQVVAIVRDVIEQRRKRHILLREKYEELALRVTTSHQWMVDQLKSRTIAELGSQPPFDARHVMVLSHLYFPELRDACQTYVNRCVEFQIMLIDLNEGRTEYDAGTQAAHRDQSKYLSVSKQLHIARDALDKAIITYAVKYTRA